MPFAHASDGTKLFYERFDPDDPPAEVVLLLMGLGANARIWAPIVQPMCAAGYSVVTMDNRGCGRSSVPWTPWSTRTMAHDASAVLDAAGTGQAHVMGASMGGMIAQELALAEPSRVRTLVLGCTTGGLPRLGLPGPAAAAAVLSSALRSLRPGARNTPAYEFVRLAVSEEFADGERDEDVWSAVEAMLADPVPARGLLQQLGAAARHSTWSRLDRLDLPVQVQHGTSDRVIPFADGRRLAESIAGAELEVIEGGGHALGIERPAEIAERALEFVRAHPLRQSASVACQPA